MAVRLNKDNFDEAVAKGLVLIDFYSDSCMPCKQLSPIVGDIEDEYEDKLKVYKVNTNFDNELTEKYQVMSAPTLVLFKDGEVADRKRGLQKKAELVSWIEGYLA